MSSLLRRSACILLRRIEVVPGQAGTLGSSGACKACGLLLLSTAAAYVPTQICSPGAAQTIGVDIGGVWHKCSNGQTYTLAEKHKDLNTVELLWPSDVDHWKAQVAAEAAPSQISATVESDLVSCLASKLLPPNFAVCLTPENCVWAKDAAEFHSRYLDNKVDLAFPSLVLYY
ncbi:hypothetical protein IE81DRAFT_349567 [Ceraceosorus guamensis]|uniref:Uncharacterized protein n=1 Tax=Ceraceosorus guamensis TaxID=1522189 RepID=A0A316VUH5_9BASI|nr:hypothetical protein IE81DRAFT_349567 [Ceraceosorus guamensis]PWN40093.1 hypothetical protein IE81DRAFT_349567 [Ceraceosorus guamensis]